MLVRRLRAELKNCVLQCQKTVGGKHEQSRSVVTSCTDFVREYVGRRRCLYTHDSESHSCLWHRKPRPARGPVFQLFGGNGNLLLSRFVNRDFTDLQVFAANTNSITGEMTVVEGLERTI